MTPRHILAPGSSAQTSLPIVLADIQPDALSFVHPSTSPTSGVGVERAGPSASSGAVDADNESRSRHLSSVESHGLDAQTPSTFISLPGATDLRIPVSRSVSGSPAVTAPVLVAAPQSSRQQGQLNTATFSRKRRRGDELDDEEGRSSARLPPALFASGNMSPSSLSRPLPSASDIHDGDGLAALMSLLTLDSSATGPPSLPEISSRELVQASPSLTPRLLPADPTGSTSHQASPFARETLVTDKIPLKQHDGSQSLTEAIDLYRQVLDLHPLGHPSRYMSLGNLAWALHNQSLKLDDFDMLAEAADLQRQAVELIPPEAQARHVFLSNLASTLRARFDKLDDLDSLTEAIVLYGQALDSCPMGHADRLRSVNDLAGVLYTRFKTLGDLDSLTAAIALKRQALGLLPLGHPSQYLSLGWLACALYSQFLELNDLDMLAEAIDLHRQALELIPLEHPNRHLYLSDLAVALATQFKSLGDRDLLSEAIHHSRQALHLCPPGHPDRSGMLNCLANQLAVQFERLGEETSPEEAADSQPISEMVGLGAAVPQEPFDHVAEHTTQTFSPGHRGYALEAYHSPNHSQVEQAPIQSQDIVDTTPDTLTEQVLEDLTLRIREAHSVHGIEVTQALIDELDQAILAAHPNNQLLSIAMSELRRWCRTCEALPRSCTLAHQITMPESSQPVSQSALSDVFRGECNGTAVAIKSIRLHMDDVAAVKKSFRTEVITWKHLRHPNIVPFLGVSDYSEVCLVSNWMPGGSLRDFLLHHPLDTRVSHIRGIVSGLDFMHRLGVIHGDLKASNILVDDSQTCRLADFGLTTVMYNSPTVATTIMGGTSGTVRWMAPELHEERPEEGGDGILGRPSAQSDIYALAITIWELFALEVPFPRVRSDAVVVWKVRAGERPPRPEGCEAVGFSENLWDAMQRGWTKNPEDRPPLGEFYALTDRQES